MEEDINILENLSTWDNIKLENGDKAIRNVLKELELAKEALKDKCEIADERNQLLVENQKLNKVIDEMACTIVDEYLGYEPCPIEFKVEDCESKDSCTGCVKQFFKKKVEERDE